MIIFGLLIALSSLIGQAPAFPSKDNSDIPVIINDSLMFIGSDVDSLTEEQQYFNPIYLVVQKGKEYLKEQLIRASTCDCDTTLPNRRIGVFSVAPGKYVSFSQGNLQYFPAANLWKFADNQYEYLNSSNKYLSPTYRNWIDLFGWSGEGSNAPFGVSTSTDNADYAGEFLDWGTNPICGDAPGTWRSMSADEWMYIFHGRKNAERLFACAKVNGVSGVVLLPDDWILPEGLSFIPSVTKGLTWSSLYDGSYADANTTYSHYQDNSYPLEQWLQMEDAGAVFLPAAGYRKTENGQVLWSPNKGYIEGTTIGGSYFTYTKVSNSQYYFFRFSDQEIRKYPYSFDRGRSVRLVHDTVVNFPEYVDLGLSVKWATYNLGATKPEEYGNYFAWGETSPKEIYSWETYKWCDGTSNNITKYNSIDNLTILQVEDDAAYVDWGENWRIPSRNELAELHTLCTWEWTTKNGVNGHVVTGPNGNSIFIPAGGSYNQFNNENITIGQQGWLLARDRASTQSAYELGTKPNGPYKASCSRCCGLNIRPVYYDAPTPLIQYKEIDISGLKINMIYVEGGTFMMGAKPEQGTEAQNDEKPVHEVILSDYYIGQTEVTQALWKAIMGTTISEHANQYGHEGGPIAGEGAYYPMYKINAADCQRFIDSLNSLTGLQFRLPTEAEWEYAARGGKYSHGYKYPGGNNLDELAWYSNNSNNETHPVAQKQPNELGIYDMAGNVWERTSDWYSAYPSDIQINPTGPTSGTQAVIRGGSRASSYGATNCRISARLAHSPTKRTFIGLRLVLDKD